MLYVGVMRAKTKDGRIEIVVPTGSGSCPFLDGQWLGTELAKKFVDFTALVVRSPDVGPIKRSTP